MGNNYVMIIIHRLNPHIIGCSLSVLASCVECHVSENLLHPEAEAPQLKCYKHYVTSSLLKQQQKIENILAQRKNLECC